MQISTSDMQLAKSKTRYRLIGQILKCLQKWHIFGVKNDQDSENLVTYPTENSKEYYNPSKTRRKEAKFNNS